MILSPNDKVFRGWLYTFDVLENSLHGRQCELSGRLANLPRYLLVKARSGLVPKVAQRRDPIAGRYLLLGSGSSSMSVGVIELKSRFHCCTRRLAIKHVKSL